MRPVLPIRCLLAPVLVAGCAAEAAPGRIADAPMWTLQEPTHLVGVDDGRPGHLLHRVRGARRLPDGTLLVANGRPQEMRAFDTAGELVGSFGRDGQGPGEFAGLVAFWTVADTVVTQDVVNQRLTHWVDGRVAREEPLGAHASRQLSSLADGRRVAWRLDWFETGEGGAARLDSTEVSLWNPAGATAPLGTFPATTTFGYEWQGQHVIGALPLSPRLQVATGPEHVFVGYPDRWEILRFHPASGAVDTFRTADLPVPLTDQVKDAWIDEILERLGEDPLSDAYRRLYEGWELSGDLPAYDRLVGDDAGGVWARVTPLPGADSTAWVAFDEEGGPRGRLATGLDFEVLDAGADWLVAQTAGELDVPRVGVYTWR